MQPPPTFRFVRRFRFTALASTCFASLVACGSPGPSPARPGAPPAPEPTPARSTGTWALARTPGMARYEIRSSATIELAEDSIPGDSLATTMVVTLSLADSGGVLSMTGTIDSLHVARGARIAAMDSAPPLPIPLHGVIDRQGGVIRFGGPAGTPDSTGIPDSVSTPDSLCAAALDPVITIARDLFVRLPARLTSGASWQDTTQTTSCRGRIPITTTTITTYTVLGEQASGGRALVALGRSMTLSLEGTGEQYGRTATVEGTGTGTGTLLIDPATAALVEGQGQSTVTITFEAGMLRQTFTQHGRQEIRQR